MIFEKGKVYRNSYGKDLDILVLDVRYVDEKRTKIYISYIFRTSGQCNGIREAITIWKKDYHKWMEVSYGQD